MEPKGSSIFYTRYADLCLAQGFDPCSQYAADKFGITRSTASSWKTKNITPRGEKVAEIADKLGTTTDYLLGRTDVVDDIPDKQKKLGADIIAMFDGEFDMPGEADDAKRILIEYRALTDAGKIRLKAYLDGLRDHG